MAGVTLYSIGHSNHPLEKFLELLAAAKIACVADVRSKPASRFAPQFNKAALAAALAAEGRSYVFLGHALGGRPDDAALLTNGKPDYAKMARSSVFAEGIEELLRAGGEARTAMLCAERDPLDCHRYRLIGRHLGARGLSVAHILAGGRIEPQDETDARAGPPAQHDLFG